MPDDLCDGALSGLLAAQYEAAPDGIALFDRASRLVTCNRRFAELWHLDRSRIAGLDTAALIGRMAKRALDAEVFQARIEELLPGCWQHGTLEVRARDGCSLIVDIRPLAAGNGESLGAVWHSRDISSARRTQQDLERSKERLELALSGTSDGLWDWDLESGRVYYSSAWGRMLGYRQEDLGHGMETWRKLIHPEDRAEVFTLLREHLKGASDLFISSHRLQTIDDSYLWVETRGRVVVGHGGRPSRMVGTIRNIHERKQAEAALKMSEDRFRTLVEGSIQGICIHRAYKPLFVNDAFAEIYGFASPEALMALPDLLGLIPQADHASAWEMWERTLAEPDYRPVVQAKNLRLDGELIWVQLMGRAVDWMGAPAFQLTVVDVTQRKRFEHDLLESRDALERQAAELASLAEDLDNARQQAEESMRLAEAANRAKSQFLATMSHELRTPLNAVLGFSEIIARETFGPSGVPQYAEYARDINNSGQHLLDLINDILDIAKIEAGKLEIARAHIYLADVLSSCVRLNQVRADERGLTLSHDIAPGAELLHADERALKQILFNLLSNAIKFTNAGGSVKITARRHDDNAVEVAIADTGIGIPEHQIERVLRPFEQLDNHYNREVGGTGLGLALVKSLVELHRGKLKIESSQGAGTTVRIIFPQAAPPPT